MGHACAMKRTPALAVALLLIAACSSDRSSSADTDAATTTTAEPTDTTASTTTNPPTTDSAVTTTIEPCLVDATTDAKASEDELLMSGLVGTDIRAGAHPCFERVVIELGGSGDFPGWNVEYVDDPVRLGESDEFVEIAGEATLQVTMRMWMPEPGGEGYAGPIDFVPENVFHVLQLRETENFEGVCIWSIGLDAQYPFLVEVFHDPERLVIDLEIPA